MTHIVEVLDEKSEQHGDWFNRYVKVIWWKPEMDWKTLPDRNQVLGFDLVISILGNSATDSVAGSLSDSRISHPKSPIQNPELILFKAGFFIGSVLLRGSMQNGAEGKMHSLSMWLLSLKKSESGWTV